MVRVVLAAIVAMAALWAIDRQLFAGRYAPPTVTVLKKAGAAIWPF
ncbi:MAG: hypothetical protein AB7K35_03960 [Pseudorhodoplanes sp.]